MKPIAVIKLGGSALDELDLMLDYLESCSNHFVVVVHGGAPQISETLARLGHTPDFYQGLRITDDVTLDVVEMVLAGKVNKSLVSALRSRSIDAVGISGVDGGTLSAPLKLEGSLGHVGDLPKVDTDLLEGLLQLGYTPVLAPLSLAEGSQGHLNVNADTAASAIAVALAASRLTFLTNVSGVLDQEGQTLNELSRADIEKLTAAGTISLGMIPKLEAALFALSGGVTTVEIRSPKPEPGTVLKASGAMKKESHNHV